MAAPPRKKTPPTELDGPQEVSLSPSAGPGPPPVRKRRLEKALPPPEPTTPVAPSATEGSSSPSPSVAPDSPAREEPALSSPAAAPASPAQPHHSVVLYLAEDGAHAEQPPLVATAGSVGSSDAAVLALSPVMGPSPELAGFGDAQGLAGDHAVLCALPGSESVWAAVEPVEGGSPPAEPARVEKPPPVVAEEPPGRGAGAAAGEPSPTLEEEPVCPETSQEGHGARPEEEALSTLPPDLQDRGAADQGDVDGLPASAALPAPPGPPLDGSLQQEGFDAQPGTEQDLPGGGSQPLAELLPPAERGGADSRPEEDSTWPSPERREEAPAENPPAATEPERVGGGSAPAPERVPGDAEPEVADGEPPRAENAAALEGEKPAGEEGGGRKLLESSLEADADPKTAAALAPSESAASGLEASQEGPENPNLLDRERPREETAPSAEELSAEPGERRGAPRQPSPPPLQDPAGPLPAPRALKDRRARLSQEILAPPPAPAPDFGAQGEAQVQIARPTPPGVSWLAAVVALLLRENSGGGALPVCT